MPRYEGQVVAGGPTRTLHRHTLIGAGIPAPGGLHHAGRGGGAARGGQAAARVGRGVDIAAPAAVRAGDVVDLGIIVKNNISAHNSPHRLDLQSPGLGRGRRPRRRRSRRVRHRDARPERRAARPPDCCSSAPFSSTLAASGSCSFWRATEHVSNALEPLREREFRLRVATASAGRGPLSVEARILFRAFSPTRCGPSASTSTLPGSRCTRSRATSPASSCALDDRGVTRGSVRFIIAARTCPRTCTSTP